VTHQKSGYGYYPGGDPRNFFPDYECCLPAEIERHRAACEAWDRGETPDPGGPHISRDAKPEHPESVMAVVEGSDGAGHQTVAHYGMGTYTFEWDCEGDPECLECHPELLLIPLEADKPVSVTDSTEPK